MSNLLCYYRILGFPKLAPGEALPTKLPLPPSIRDERVDDEAPASRNKIRVPTMAEMRKEMDNVHTRETEKAQMDTCRRT